MRVARNGHLNDKPMALEFPIELEFRNVDFLWREENQRTRRKTLGARTRTNIQLNPFMTPGLGFEASTITTAPSLLSRTFWCSQWQ